MTSVPDMLEQMTWAINEGGPLGPGRGKQEVYEFLSNIAPMLAAPRPSLTSPTRPPLQPYSPDVLPLIQQMAWLINEFPTNVLTFLKTLSFYFSSPLRFMTGPYVQPMTPPLPPALQYMPMEDLEALYQVIYWLLNEGAFGNQKARGFLEAIGYYLSQGTPRTLPGQFRYPS